MAFFDDVKKQISEATTRYEQENPSPVDVPGNAVGPDYALPVNPSRTPYEDETGARMMYTPDITLTDDEIEMVTPYANLFYDFLDKYDAEKNPGNRRALLGIYSTMSPIGKLPGTGEFMNLIDYAEKDSEKANEQLDTRALSDYIRRQFQMMLDGYTKKSIKV